MVRISSDVIQDRLTLWSPKYIPDNLINYTEGAIEEGALHSIGEFSIDIEDYAGEVKNGFLEIRAVPERTTGLHSSGGGFLHGLSETVYILVALYLTDGKTEWCVVRGKVKEITVNHGEGMVVLGCDTGLAIYDDKYDNLIALDETYFQGRHAYWLYKEFADILGISKIVYDEPLIAYPEPRFSYAEHPEKRFCEGQEGATATPTHHCYAMASDGSNNLYVIVDRDLLRYEISTHKWWYVQTIADVDMVDLTGMYWRAVGMLYIAAPPSIDVCFQRVPESIQVGVSPNALHSEVVRVTTLL